MNDRRTLGDVIFEKIDDNDFLNVLYNNLLYNYALKCLRVQGFQNRREVDIPASLRFADILSKSTHKQKSDAHKMWAQEIVTLLRELYPDDTDVQFYIGAVLTNVGNYRGRDLVKSKFKGISLEERAYNAFCRKYLAIPGGEGKIFFAEQKNIYDQMHEEQFLSYSAPTSMGKSFIMEMFIKDQVIRGKKSNFARIVPTKALINEVRHDTIYGLEGYLEEMDYRIVTAASDISLDEEHNFILIMTPERLLYLMISRPDFAIDYIFIDEAHKLGGRNGRGPFYYKVVDMLAQREHMPHFVFASPNIPNPEEYLKMVTEAQKGNKNAKSFAYAPVTQFKFLVSKEDRTVRIYNDQTRDFQYIAKFKTEDMSVLFFLNFIYKHDSERELEKRQRNIAYFSGKQAAITSAIQFAEDKPDLGEKELKELADDIRSQVHGDYYLAKIVEKGVAYHVGYLPASIRLRIEELFKAGKIVNMFCTSTLIEGVNLPADNLFITTYNNGRSRMTDVEFNNLIGRVGRIKFNLYGNVFCISDGEKKSKQEEFQKLLSSPVKEQKLSVVESLAPKLKKHVIDTFLEGNAEIKPYNSKQPEEEYIMMRKFGLIFQNDVISGRNSLVKREFLKYAPPRTEEIIKEKFQNQKIYMDNDINVSAEQTRRLSRAIREDDLEYPEVEDGKFKHQVVFEFLIKLGKIFNWDLYESKTLGKKDKDGNYTNLKWYTVLLCRWMGGFGLNAIMRYAIQYYEENPERFWENQYTPSYYEGTAEHKNIVFADTLEAIENIILFSISNYFLRFSNMYREIKGEDSLNTNNWYEYVEYGTTNPITVTLQRNGFSREAATYIRDHQKQDDYIIEKEDGTIKLRMKILECKNTDVREEAKIIHINIPSLFEQ